VDQAAAVLILQQVLDCVRATGTLPGVVVQTSPTAEAPE
jgi:hypothetical protein